MPISCSDAVTSSFELGVAMLHSFWYEEARREFDSVAQRDPSCAMAQWGLAMTEWRPFWDGLPERRLEAGIVEIEKATALHAPTNREQRYIGALSGYLLDDRGDRKQAVIAYADAIGALSKAYPRDVEAQAFHGLSLTAAAQLDTNDPIAADRKALAVLEPGLRANPDHPGFAHYIIHACDNPQLAREALPAAERYAAIAPASAHALHMSSHIFARLGMWPQDVAANLASVQASQLAEKNHLEGVAHELHAYEFLLFAYLQEGDEAEARRVHDLIVPTIGHLAAVPGIEDDGMYASAGYIETETNVIYYLERHRWNDLLAIPEPSGKSKSTLYYLAWAKAIAAGHLRSPEAADQAVARARSVYRAVAYEGSTISAEEHAMFLTMEGWQSYAHRQDADALLKLSTAADEQDRVGQAEVDIPVREMYADLLLAEGQFQDALAQYERALKIKPNRWNGLVGAIQAAKAAGKPDKARRYSACIERNATAPCR